MRMLLLVSGLIASVTGAQAGQGGRTLYSVYMNQGVTVNSYIVSQTLASPGVHRVETLSTGPRSVFPSGRRAATYRVSCPERYVSGADGRTDIDPQSTPIHAESDTYNLWWAVCRGQTRKF